MKFLTKRNFQKWLMKCRLDVFTPITVVANSNQWIAMKYLEIAYNKICIKQKPTNQSNAKCLQS